jgi:hypothetical protein
MYSALVVKDPVSMCFIGLSTCRINGEPEEEKRKSYGVTGRLKQRKEQRGRTKQRCQNKIQTTKEKKEVKKGGGRNKKKE